MKYIAPKFCRRLVARHVSTRTVDAARVAGSLGLWLAYAAVALGQTPPATVTGSAAGAATTAAAAFQDQASLEAAAKAGAEGALPPLSEHQRFVIGPVQAAQLERCKQALKPVVSAGQHMKDRVMVEVRCPDLPANLSARSLPRDMLWHIYIPVRVIGTSSVAIASHTILMGSVLSAADFRIEQHDLSELPLGYIDDPSVAVGLTAARAIAAGTMLTNQQLAAAKIVQRGQAVTLVADAGGMSVRMAGKALSDGMLNQRIKVQNLSSGKVVEGLARSEQVVEIVFQ